MDVSENEDDGETEDDDDDEEGSSETKKRKCFINYVIRLIKVRYHSSNRWMGYRVFLKVRYLF